MVKHFKLFSALLAVALSTPVMAYAADSAAPAPQSADQSNGVLSGVVRDADDVIIGASVLVKGTTKGASTDLDGAFTISGVTPGSTIQVSYVGYKTQEIVWKGGKLDVLLQPGENVLDEVVVTALGIKRSTKALGYAVTELKGDDLNSNLINPVQALQGKVAGVDISSSDGGMFGASKILIRGASTLGKNNQPIYVVDGIILDNGVVSNDADWASGNANYGNELKNLNPDDFETVSVLKGAAATALYGSRGLNGAVVITTKSGKGTKGLGINFTQTFGFDRVTGQPELQNEFTQGFMPGYKSGPDKFDSNNIFWTNSDGIPSFKVLENYGSDAYYCFGPSFKYLQENYGRLEWWDGSIIYPQAYENNFKDAYDTGFSSNTNVAISGGNDKTTFYTSLSYKYAEGTLPNNSFDRFSLLAKASHKITDAVELEASVNFAKSMPRNAQPNIGENFCNMNWDRTYDSKYFRDKYKGDHGGLASATYGDKYAYIPGIGTWWSIWENDYYQKETVVRPDLKVTAQILPWLKWVTEGSYNYYYVRKEQKNPGSGYQNKGGYYSLGFSQKEQINANTNFMFDKQLNEDWHINGFLRYELYHDYSMGLNSWTKGDFIVPNQYFLSNGSEGIGTSQSIGGTKTIQSIAAQFGFSWRDQIYVDVTGRNDWSSALVYADGHGNFSYFYPSINASWLIHETLRGKLPSWISFAKIRASWAQVGNDCSAYYVNSAYSLSSYSNNSSSYYSLSLPSTSYSQDLKPERKTSWEIGLDWRFLGNRIGIDATYYKENTKDQIMSVSIPGVSGYSSALINAGNIQNQGVEIALNTTPIETKDLTWDLNFTYTKNKSKIVELSDLVANYISLNGDVGYGNYRIGSVAKVGGEYGLLLSDASPKKDWVYDEDGNKIGGTGKNMIYWNETQRAAYLARTGTLEEVGTMLPKFLGSVNTSIKYKRFTLSASFDMRFGGKVASYNSRYGNAYGYTKLSAKYRNLENGGFEWTSFKSPGVTFEDGYIPDGIVAKDTQILQPDGSYYTVGSSDLSPNGELYADLYAKGVIEPQHGGTWIFKINNWGAGVVNDTWFKTLNYIAFRDLSLSYSFSNNIASKIHAKSLNLTAAAHNLGYLLNSMPNKENPEAVAGTETAEFRVRQFSGITTSFTLTINASF
ncbi:MAG: SusC/RagA family TonB-linked outer membrane protein [Muribaculaceae bacterium]